MCYMIMEPVQNIDCSQTYQIPNSLNLQRMPTKLLLLERENMRQKAIIEYLERKLTEKESSRAAGCPKCTEYAHVLDAVLQQIEN